MKVPSDLLPSLPRPARHWVLAMLSPVAWSAAFGIWIALTVQICSERTKPAVLVVALVAIVGTVVATLMGLRALRRHQEADGGAQVERFMHAFTLGAGLLFTLVVALSAVPVFLLKACPT